MLPIFLALAFIALLLFILIAGRPDQFKVTRSATLNAPPTNVFPHVNDLHKWEAWSPWAKLDPNAKSVFEGPSEGVGACLKVLLRNRETWLNAVFGLAMTAPMLAFAALWAVPYLTTIHGIDRAAAAGVVSFMFAGWRSARR